MKKFLLILLAAWVATGALLAQKEKPAAVPASAPVAATQKSFSPTIFGEFTLNFALSAGLTAVHPNNADAFTSAWDFDSADASGLGLGGTLGYYLFDHLAIVGHAHFRDIKSRLWSNTTASSTGATDKATYQIKHPLMSVGLGVRSMTRLFFLDAYAGAGLAMVLPSTRTTVMTCTTSNAIDCQASAYFGYPTNTKSVEISTAYNLSFGVYGEIGLQYHVFENLYISFGGMFVTATITDKDKSTTQSIVPVQSTGASTVTTTTSTGTEVSTPGVGTNVKYQQETIADILFTFSIGCRF